MLILFLTHLNHLYFTKITLFSKAPPRKTLKGGTKIKKVKLYTDTPEKEDGNWRERPQKTGLFSVKSQNEESSIDKPEEYFYLVYVESYSHIRSGENWVQRSGCRLWRTKLAQQVMLFICAATVNLNNIRILYVPICYYWFFTS